MSDDETLWKIRRDIAELYEDFKNSPDEVPSLESLLSRASDINISFLDNDLMVPGYSDRSMALNTLRLKIANKILELDSDNLEAYHTIFSVYWDQGHEDLYAMERIAELDTRHHQFSENVAEQYLRVYESNGESGALEKAIRFFRLYIEAQQSYLDQGRDDEISFDMVHEELMRPSVLVRIYNGKVIRYEAELYGIRKQAIENVLASRAELPRPAALPTN